jgi:hypothetical protein
MDNHPERSDRTGPYDHFAPIAYYLKALIQMGIGVWVVVAASTQVIEGVATDSKLFEIVGHGLAFAAVVELGYTLFTPGADETLDPLMLAIAALLLIRIGQINKLDWRDAISVMLYVVCLAGLFAVRKFLVEIHREATVSLLDVWRRFSALGRRRRTVAPTSAASAPADPTGPADVSIVSQRTGD